MSQHRYRSTWSKILSYLDFVNRPALISCLSSYSRRWQLFSVHGLSAGHIQYLVPCMPIPHSLYFPSAQVLATQDTSEPSDFEDSPVIFACIPNTQITRDPFQINSTKLKIMKIYIEDFGHMLTGCSNASSLRIVMSVSWSICLSAGPHFSSDYNISTVGYNCIIVLKTVFLRYVLMNKLQNSSQFQL